MAVLSSTTNVTTSTATASSYVKAKLRCSPHNIFHHRLFTPYSSSCLTTLCPGRCRAANPGPPPPQKTDPLPEDDSIQFTTGLAASFSKFQDRIQIFFAVLFWMSLFFWASAWDGKNRPNKGSRFRK